MKAKCGNRLVNTVVNDEITPYICQLKALRKKTIINTLVRLKSNVDDVDNIIFRHLVTIFHLIFHKSS